MRNPVRLRERARPRNPVRLRERNPLIVGVIGSVVIALVVLGALNLRSLPGVDRTEGYTARFVDTGGLGVGDPVRIAGKDAGRVTDIRIDGDAVRIEFTVDDRIGLGSDTRAEIATATALGARELRVLPAGPGRLDSGAVLDVDRTTAPYDLAETLGRLGRTGEEIDMEQLAVALETVSSTLGEAPEHVDAAIDGVGRLSASIVERDAALRELFADAETLSALLARRGEEIDTLLRDARVLLAALREEQESLETLAGTLRSFTVQIRGLISDHDRTLAPTLERVKGLQELVLEHREGLALAIQRLGPYATELGEAVASGPFFNSYIQNLLPVEIIEPALNDALTRAGVGVPPAPAAPPAGGPR
ncbi:MCE family protein [Dietzia lutea]|uniref:Mammalian cell entry protein n=1 Tax=Dietzia lutea TaxID=546160 RepID=A0A2S1RCB5_9ACTN|nr:MlaD family protein [Dietzia lutea]AWH93949.1 mammalian cell entry protein [Dietzia lutea]